ncbi:CsbD family protein [Acidomonas methanolica]|uniref:CsbD family protein n=1 Tax=Acidomonas methanolica TaxID=437 RepID=UPI002119C3D7|nr:CsbD family protein [Acidomonas methanolica]MCQ9155289.1 CsbD family protein [Acidomonas methanolica]
MDDSTKAKAEGLLDEAKGRVKDAVGGLTGDVGMQASGKVDQLSGMAQQEFADLYEDAESRLEMATAFVQDRPLLALGIVAVIGTLIGALLFGRRGK